MGLITSNEWKNDSYFKKLFKKTIIENKHIPRRIKTGIIDYEEELRLLYESSNFNLDVTTNEPLINEVLCGGGRYSVARP
jgi:hypothetical protein